MSKTKILLWHIAGCIAFGTTLGVSFWWFDGGKTPQSVKVYQGKSVWDTIKIGEAWRTVEYLEVIK